MQVLQTPLSPRLATHQLDDVLAHARQQPFEGAEVLAQQIATRRGKRDVHLAERETVAQRPGPVDRVEDRVRVRQVALELRERLELRALPAREGREAVVPGDDVRHAIVESTYAAATRRWAILPIGATRRQRGAFGTAPPDERSSARPGAGVVRKMARLVRAGHSLIVFPEGTRSTDGSVAQFKGGPFMIALQAALPVVPISVVGSRHVMFRGEVTVRPGRVTVIVHDPIETANIPRAAAREFAATVRDVVASDAFGALVYRVKQACERDGVEPIVVLKRLDADTLGAASGMLDPAAYLTKHVRDWSEG